MAKLVLVPVPIGNLKDITIRAIETLQSCALVICEDTRVTSRLLTHYEIKKKLISFNVVNEHKIVKSLIDQISDNELTCLVSDAGTPAISDPGFLLVRECIRAGIDVECLPGPTAFVPALIQSGFAMHNFIFDGFLPHKKGKLTRIKALLDESRTTIFYESPHRLRNTLQMMLDTLGSQRKICVCRELTKMFEETCRGTTQDVFNHFNEKEVKGEIVIVVEGNEN